MDQPTCPICGQPVDTNTESHVTAADGTVYHADCYSAQTDSAHAPLE